MKQFTILKKRIFVILMALVLVFSLAACGDKQSGPVPEGKYVCTHRDEGFGDGLEPVQADEFMTFNADGTGRWEYALDSPITWKLKGDKLTIVETVGENEYKFEGTWDGEKILLNVDGYGRLFEKTGSTSPTESAQTTAPAVSVDSALVGRYDCTGSEMDGFRMDPDGEWMELKADGTGIWFFGVTEEHFEWTVAGDTINFTYGDTQLDYTATLEEDQIILDTGTLYYFAEPGGTPAPQPTESGETEKPSKGAIEPAGSIQVPSEWYGVAILTDCVGIDYEDGSYDVWGTIDKDSVGTYFELYLVPEATESEVPILSMYIDEEEQSWLTPIIGYEDAWAVGLYLTEEDDWALLTMYDEGALDIQYTFDNDDDIYAECRFFVREYGTAWDEAVDPLPASYDDYAASIK